MKQANLWSTDSRLDWNLQDENQQRTQPTRGVEPRLQR